MHALSKPFRQTQPLVDRTLAGLAGFLGAFAWAQRMRRDCERWQRSGRALDGAAVRLIADRLEREHGRR